MKLAIISIVLIEITIAALCFYRPTYPAVRYTTPTRLREIPSFLVNEVSKPHIPDSQRTPPADWWVSTNYPVVALWDGGVTMIGEPPFVLFALWADGMIVRNVDGRLKRGEVASQEIGKLMTEVEAAGFFSSPLPFGLTRPDGPVRRIAAMRNGKLTHLDYDGDSDFRNVGPHASPSRQQSEAFVQMWQRVVRAIEVVPSGQLSDYHGERELRYPSRWLFTGMEPAGAEVPSVRRARRQ